MTDSSFDEGKCFQCGRSEFVFAPDEGENGWIVCDWCGERFISAEDFKKRADLAKERRIRDNLGVEEFLKSRRADDDP